MSPQFPPRIQRLGRLEKILLLLLALSVAVSLTERFGARSVPGSDLLRLAGYIAALILAFKFFHVAVRRMLWRVRHRMILLFLFIGLVPLLLVTALIGLAGYILTGQVAVYIATSELDRRAGRLHGAAATLAWSLRSANASRRVTLARNYMEPMVQSWSGLRGVVMEDERWAVFPADAELEAPRSDLRESGGLIRRQNRLFLMARASGAQVTLPGTASGPVTARPLGAPASPIDPAGSSPALVVILLAPVNEPFLDELAPGLGRISLVSRRRGAPPDAPGEFVRTGSRTPLPEPAYKFDYAVTWFTLPFRLERWRDSDEASDVMLQIQTRPSAVFRLLFGQRVQVEGVVIFFMIVGTLFLIAELLSLVAGVSITRTLTNSVHALYEGTQKVNRGEFSHRIEVSGHDQLAELSRSFNSMTESIEGLIEESKERQRLASEIEIAREVQAQLFPKASPEMRGLEVLGVCHAARMVSGDYYDFVKLSDERLALAIGDVAGKGISGALLMASIQSMLRSQLTAAAGKAETDGPVWRFPTAELVSQMNLQLYHNTSPEKYATFFFGAYDDRHGLLTYTNAGHLPPILVRDGEARRLDVNGMVVGAFPFARYEQSEVELHLGDLLVAFTDGVTEPENEFAEEFGEDRLIELVVRNRNLPAREIIDEVIAAVGRWTGRPELQDDMTMLVARRI